MKIGEGRKRDEGNENKRMKRMKTRKRWKGIRITEEGK